MGKRLTQRAAAAMSGLRSPRPGRSFRPLSKTDTMKGSENDDRERDMMRMLIIALFVVATGLLGETQLGNAQSAYSYPWCSLGGGRGSNALSCYYTSWEQCAHGGGGGIQAGRVSLHSGRISIFGRRRGRRGLRDQALSLSRPDAAA